MASDEIGERRWAWGGGALHTVHWGDDTAAFHEATASTHLFDEDTLRLVQALRHADCAVTSAVLWNTAFGEASSESDSQALDERLVTLLQAGMVTATDS